MWDSPNWIGTAISAKVKKQSDAAARASNEAIAEADRVAAMERARLQHEASMYATDVSANTALANRIVNERIANADRISREAIAADEIQSRETIASWSNATSSEIARLNRELQSNENDKQRSWQSAENQLDRATRKEVATISAAGGVVSSGVRLIPLVVGKDSSNNNFKFNGTATSGKSPVVTQESTPKTAKEKADDLFPDLEPTWSDKLPSVSKNKSLLSSSALAGVATLVTGALLSVVPFI